MRVLTTLLRENQRKNRLNKLKQKAAQKEAEKNGDSVVVNIGKTGVRNDRHRDTVEEPKDGGLAFIVQKIEGGGLVTTDDVTKFMKDLNLPPMDKSEMAKKFRAAGADGFGISSLPHFFKFILNECASHEVLSCVDAFLMFDKEDTGFIADHELKWKLAHLGDKMSEEELCTSCMMWDMDGDGDVHYDCALKILAENERSFRTTGMPVDFRDKSNY